MANSKNTVTSVPLSCKLNMNRNQNQVCTTYDQMNKQNSPLFGGCIFPLHTKSQYTGNKSIIDKYGHRWYFNGTSLIRTDENNINAITTQNFSGDYVFNKSVLNTSSICGCIGTNGVLTLESGPNWNRVRNHTTNGIVSTYWYDPNVWAFRNARLVYIGDYRCMLIQVFESLTSITAPVLTVYNVFNDVTGQTLVDFTWYQTNLGIAASNGRWNYDANNRVATTSKSSSQYTYPIIVSAPLAANMIGITVLNRHMNGENVYDDFGYINFVADFGSAFIVPIYLTPNPFMGTLWGNNRGSLWADLLGGKVPSESNGEWSLSAQGGQIVNRGSESDQDWVTMRCPAGIWQDGNNMIVQINYNPANLRGFIKGEDNDYLNIYSAAGGLTSSYNNMCWSTQKGLLFPDIANNTVWFTDNNRPPAWAIVSYRKNPDSTGHDENYTESAFFIDADESGQICLGEQRNICNTTVTTNQYHTRVIVAGEGSSYGWGSGSTKVNGNFTMLDSMNYGQTRSMPGVMSTTTIPTTADGWTDIAKNRFVSKDSFYCTSGSCTQIGMWRILFNYKEGFLSGISWDRGNSEIEGTLVTPWDEVDDGFVVSVKGNQILYKDVTGKLNLITAIATSSVNMLDYTEIVDNRYLLIHCDSTQNVFDLVNERWGKFASDWNNRIHQGFNKTFANNNLTWRRWIRNNMNPNNFVSYFFTTATWASGFNVAYQATKSFSPSRLLPYVTGNYTVCMEPYSVGNLRTIKDVLYGKVEKCALDYFQSKGTSSPQWKGAFNGTNNTEDSTSLQGTAWPITSSGSLYNNLPIIGTNFVNSYNGKFATQIDNKGYSMVYDGVRPVMLYNATSIVDDIKEFFIVQSQTYAVVDSYICAISYSSSNVINGIEQLVDINGMTFIGAFPSVAYFYSPASRSIYAFTGDADLQLFVQTDRISKVYSHLYAPNNEWIHIVTNDGIYVLTQQNVFKLKFDLLPSYNNNISDISLFMTDDAWNVIQYRDSDGNYRGLKMRLDKPDDTWDTVPVEIETEFFGPGDMKQDVCDTWYIRLFKGDESDNNSVLLYVKTLTDVVTKTDEKEMVITPDMWDDNDNVFIRYQPKFQMTQGSSLHIETKYPVAYLGVSHQMDNTSNGHLNI